MNREAIIWTIVVLLAGGFLMFRAAMRGNGTAYVEQIPVEVQTDEATYNWTDEVGIDPSKRGEPNVFFSWQRTIGIWVAALLTLAILSFLWGDNPLYKIAESIFVGASAGYAMVVGFWTGIIEKLFGNLTPELMSRTFMPGLERPPDYLYIIPLLLGIMLLWRLAPVGGWIARWPLAFVIGATAGFRLVTFLHADFVQQIQNTIIPLVVASGDGSIDLWGSLRNITIVIGVLSCLTYFFFSFEHKGVVGGVSRIGIWFLMITFGAGFGYTVMGRIALLSERLEFLFDDWLWLIDPALRRVGM